MSTCINIIELPTALGKNVICNWEPCLGYLRRLTNSPTTSLLPLGRKRFRELTILTNPRTLPVEHVNWKNDDD